MSGNVIWFFCLFVVCSTPNKNEAFEKLPKGLMSDLPSDCSLMVGDFIENTPQYFQHWAPLWELDPPLLQKFVVFFPTPLLLNGFIFFSWERSLTFKLIERATDARMSSLEYNQWLHHWLLPVLRWAICWTCICEKRFNTQCIIMLESSNEKK